MATIRRRGIAWQVQVRRQGHTPLSRTFRLKSDAKLWATQKEAQLDRGELPVDTRVLRSHTFADLLERYAATIVPRKRSADRELYMLRVILRHPIACLSLDRLTPTEVAKYRDDRLALVSGDTARRELAIVRHCLEVARNEWGFALSSNPVHQVKLPRPSNPRERRATADELERLLAACEATTCHWLPAIIELAVETGMRRSELLAIRWDDVDLRARTVSPTLSKEIMNAVMDALAAHTTMSKQAIASERVRDGLKDVLLGPAQLYEALRDKAGERT